MMSLRRIETMWRMGLYTGGDDVGVLEDNSNDSRVSTKNGGRLRQETTWRSRISSPLFLSSKNPPPPKNL
jgi:hypothetical protein